MTRSRTSRSRARAALGAAVAAILLAGSLTAYAATRKPTFGLSATSSPLSVAPGGHKEYRVKVARRRGFRSAVTLRVTKLPRGASARWTLPNRRKLRTRGGAGVLPAGRSAAVLTVRTAPGTPAGRFKPVIKAVGGRVRRTSRIALEVRAASGPTLALLTTAAGADLLQGDRTTLDVTLVRGGFDGAVDLGVSGLPAGVSASFEPGPRVDGSAAALVLDATRAAAPGSYQLAISAAAAGVAPAATAVTLVVKETKTFDIAGDVAAPLVPGARQPLDLVLTNPHDFDLVVTRLEARVAATDRPGCAPGANYRVTPIAPEALPLRVRPGASSLTALGVRAAALPHVEMPNLATSQDDCQGARIELAYSGLATR